MEVIKAIWKLIVSIILWIILAIPRLIVIILSFFESVFRILKKTFSHLVDSISDEFLK